MKAIDEAAQTGRTIKLSVAASQTGKAKTAIERDRYHRSPLGINFQFKPKKWREDHESSCFSRNW